MPINTKHAGYALALSKSEQTKDFAAGEFVVKAKGVQYLPKLSGQTSADYESYLGRGYVVPSVLPTALSIGGSIMRRPPMFEGGADYLQTNIDGDGLNLDTFIGNMIKELLLAGSVGYLVEYIYQNAYIKTYTLENLINYSEDFIVLAQTYTVTDPKDKFTIITKTEYLELTFDDDDYYIQNLWREEKTGWKITETFEPSNRGERLTEIPFVFVSPENSGLKASDPILLNLSNINLDQYRLSTDLRHGLHWTALPTLFLFGDLRDENGTRKSIVLGAGSANIVEDTDARAELLEFTGSGLGAIKQAIDDDIMTMASIGAKMLMSGGGGVKAAETARIDASSETATLSTIANTVDLAMEQLLTIVTEWTGLAETTFKINRDFIDIKLDSASLLALLQTWQSGGMSLDSFLYQLEKGELLPPDVTAADEADRIDTTGNDFE